MYKACLVIGIAFLPLSAWPRLAHLGPYVGLSLGWSSMSGKRTFAWVNQVGGAPDYYFFKDDKQFGSGVDNNILLGFRSICWPLLWGIEGTVGTGYQKIQYHHHRISSCFVISDVSEKWHASLSGLLGYDWDGWAVFGKMGVVDAKIEHFYQEQDPGRTKYDPPVYKVSPALGVGVLVEKAISSQLALRLDYTCAFHGAIKERFRDKRDEADVIQNLDSFRNQSIMFSLCWYPFKRRRYCFFS